MSERVWALSLSWLLGVAVAFPWLDRSGSSSHFLQHFYLGVSEPIQGLPWFTQLGYVDDQLITRYDSNKREDQPQVSWMEKAEDARFWERETHHARDAEFFFMQALVILQTRYNQNGGLHTWQCLVGCELSKDEKQKGRSMQCGYDGKDFISLDKETFTWMAAEDAAQYTKRKWDADPDIAEILKGYLEGDCIERLRKYLDYANKALLKTEPPIVKVTRKVGHDGLGTFICCVYGFYPQEIKATWRKDGEDWEQETFSSGILPNSDGTYNTWLSMEIDPNDTDHYQCHVEHFSLPEPLSIAWEVPVARLQENLSPHPAAAWIFNWLRITYVLSAASILLLMPMFILYIKIWQRNSINREAPMSPLIVKLMIAGGFVSAILLVATIIPWIRTEESHKDDPSLALPLAKEPDEEDCFQCRVEYEDLPKPLALVSRKPASVPVGAILRAMGVILLVPGISIYIKKRQQDASKASYKATSSGGTQEQEEVTLSSRINSFSVGWGEVVKS
ncbi:major histocompatibility complex class I-related gene protein-like isoform X1 [Hemicordylus capensis]|uniref:major histocompatibility complex class I-related gene protein-like isoform X1 n=1 Tax=Hemicordylus capensis TaxID=884348 RepID=UPI002303BD2E|nr:major histocompatibility complex class I-related gene protein-like isoform X1 [Hemicordylus capensis]